MPRRNKRNDVDSAKFSYKCNVCGNYVFVRATSNWRGKIPLTKKDYCPYCKKMRKFSS